MRAFRGPTLFAVTMAALSFCAAISSGQLTPVSMHPDGRTQSFAEDVNNTGQTVGGYTVESYPGGYWTGTSAAVLWDSAGAMTELDPDRFLGDTWAKGIKDCGKVFGVIGFPRGSGVGAFMWDSAAGLVRVPKLVHNGVEDWGCDPIAMNENGWLIGGSSESNGTGHGWIYRNGTLTEVTNPTIPGSRIAVSAINNVGHVVGHANYGTYSAVLWQMDEGGTVTLTDLAPELVGSEARGINDAEQVAIRAQNGDVYLWAGGTLTPVTLPTYYSRWYTNVVGIDEYGRIFGTGRSTDGTYRLWMWQGDVVSESLVTIEPGPWYDLRISNAGHMSGYLDDGERHGFVWNAAEGTSGLQMLDGLVAGGRSNGSGLNDSGHVAGFAVVPEDNFSRMRACIWGRPANQPPISNAGPDQQVPGIHDGNPEGTWATVTLDGSGSSDPDGDKLTYTWTDEEWGQIAAGANPTIALERGLHWITLTVTDPSGASSSDGMFVEITPEPNQPPVADAGPDRSVTATHTGQPEEDTARFYVGSSSTDPEGDELHYEWSENGATITSAEFFPVTRPAGTYTFSLTVWDAYGASSTDEVTVTVLPAGNEGPVANAGTDFSVAAIHDGDPTTTDAIIRLNGSGSSDAEHDRLAFVWTEGGVVCAGGPRPYLTRSAGVYTFTLTVTDPYGASSSDDVTVTVRTERNYTPWAEAGPDQTVVATGATTSVTLDGSSSYDWDDETLAYTWTENEVQLGSGVTPAVELTPGVHTIALTVTDPYGESGTDTVVVSVSALDVSNPVVAKNGKTFTVTATITNRTPLTVNNVTVTGASLGGVNTNSPVPLLFGAIKPGASKQCKLQFKNVPAGPQTLSVTGTCSLGAFFSSQTVIVP